VSKKDEPGLSGVEKLNETFDLSAFNSGKEALDEWLRKYALVSQKSDSAKTYVVHRERRVAGYYSLAASCISTSGAPKRIAAGQPQKGSVPVIILARLAVDKSEQGKGLGAALLKDALLRGEEAADSIGVRAVLVHALDKEARGFYGKHDFEPSPVDDMTLMLLMKDIRRNITS
jgi:GNAT superfamily N-acetyltransferase